MATRLRKVRRLRGSRTHGWGQIGQHRRTGAKGGSGMAGLHKHKWSYTVKYMPDHFGSNKWHPPNPTTTKKWINLGKLESLAGSDRKVDLVEQGYDKLLGEGNIMIPIQVRTLRASKSAIEKIKKAGGSVEVLEAGEPEEADEKKEGTSAKKAAIQKK
ncbi:MAG: 50S ribosomal protein L15 [Thaumarchaeota archaeon]|nr:50S ribosomal protein L15 [Nitrososphaerota archaeon]